MHGAALNPSLIRPLLIVLFLVITQILRAAKVSKTPSKTPPKTMSETANPGTRTGVGTATQLGDVFREAMRQRAEQTRARQSQQPVNVDVVGSEVVQVGEEFHEPPFQPPPKIEPESSFVPSLLLLALLACLCLMAYRYWAG